MSPAESLDLVYTEAVVLLAAARTRLQLLFGGEEALPRALPLACGLTALAAKGLTFIPLDSVLGAAGMVVPISALSTMQGVHILGATTGGALVAHSVSFVALPALSLGVLASRVVLGGTLATMAAGSAYYVQQAATAEHGQRPHLVAAALCAVTAGSYLLQLLGDIDPTFLPATASSLLLHAGLPVPDLPAVAWTRLLHCAQWALATPLTVLNLGYMAGSSPSELAPALLANLACVGLGAGALVVADPATKWALAAASVGAFSYLFHELRSVQQAKASYLGHEAGKRYCIASALAVATWGWLGLSEAAALAGMVSSLTEASLLAALDVVATMGTAKIMLRNQGVLATADHAAQRARFPLELREWMHRVDEERQQQTRSLEDLQMQVEQLRSHVMPLLRQVTERREEAK